MRVELTNGGLIVDGMLKGIIEQHGPPYPHIVIELKVSGQADPVKVTLNDIDLVTIMQLARGSTVQRIRDAVV
jgi:hypothetical protein